MLPFWLTYHLVKIDRPPLKTAIHDYSHSSIPIKEGNAEQLEYKPTLILQNGEYLDCSTA
jgi:hypothetical protein